MRIEKIEIDAFGALKDRNYGSLPAGLNVFLGNNEAGKSTILAFVRAMFFGFPDRRKNRSSYEPLEPGVFGGRLVIVSEDGKRLTVERKRNFDGMRSQRPLFRLYDENGQLLPDSSLQVYFGSISRPLYENVFGFSLDELQVLDSLSGSEIRDAIYGASFGTALLAVPAARKRLEKDLGGLFKPSGQNQEINRLLVELDATKARIAVAKGQLEKYQRCVRVINETEDSINRVESRLRHTEKELQCLRQIVSCWNEYRELIGLKEQIEALKRQLGDRIPSNRELWQARVLDKEVSEASTLLIEKRAEHVHLLARLEGIRVNEGFLKRSKQIQQLLAKRHHFSHLEQEILKRGQELEDLNGELHDGFVVLGGDWSEDKVSQVDTGAAVRSALQAFRKAFDEISTNLVLLDRESGVRQQDLKRLEEELDRLCEKVKVLNGKLEHVDREILDEAVQDLARAEIAFKELTEVEQEVAVFYDKVVSKAKGLGLNNISLEKLSGLDFKGLLKRAWELFDDFADKRQRYRLLGQRHYYENEDLLRLNDRLECKKKEFSDLENRFLLSDDEIRELSALASSLSGAIPQRPQIGASLNSMDMEKKGLEKRLRTVERVVSLWSAMEKAVMALYPLGLSLIILPFVPGFYGYGNWLFIAAGVFVFLTTPLISRWCKKQKNGYASKRQELIKEKVHLEHHGDALADELQRIEKGLKRLSALAGIDEEVLLTDFSKAANMAQSYQSFLEEKNAVYNEIRGLEDLVFERRNAVKAIEAHRAKLKGCLDSIERSWKELFQGIGFQAVPELKDFHVFSKDLEGLWLNITAFSGIDERRVHKKETLEELLSRLAHNVGLSKEDISGLTLDQRIFKIKDSLKSLMSCLDELEQTERQQTRVKQERSRLLAAVQDILTKREGLLAEKNRVLEDWLQFLKDTDMPCSGNEEPGDILELFVMVDRQKQLLLKRHRLEKGLGELKGQLGDARMKVKEILHELCPDFEFDSLGQAVDYLVGLLEQENQKAEEAQQIRRERAYLENEIVELEKRIREAQDRLRQLFENLSVSTLDELEGLLRKAVELEKKEVRLNELLLAISSQFHIEPEWDRVVALFSKRSFHDMEVDVKELERTEEELLKERDRLYKERAEAVQALKGLVSSTEHQELLAKYEMLRAGLKELALKWSMLALAKTLLEEATRRFEQENQPKVLSEASRHFMRITKGRYQGILPDQGHGFVAISSSGRRYSPDKLSRGTAELLYLCLRFGVISACEPGPETIPVLMDDIFVNFDPERMELAAKAVAQLAEKRQVLFFTCHPHVASVLTNVAHQAKLVNM